jgi:hypothetical protein
LMANGVSTDEGGRLGDCAVRAPSCEPRRRPYFARFSALDARYRCGLSDTGLIGGSNPCLTSAMLHPRTTSSICSVVPSMPATALTRLSPSPLPGGCRCHSRRGRVRDERVRRRERT